jgi:solute carrier family 35 protein E3
MGEIGAVVIVGVVVNILSVVGIVITNKYITEVDGYNFMVFLSFLHFSFTCLGTRVMLLGNFFSHNHAPLSGILPVAAGSLLSVAFMNLNLANNSVGFYQLSKLVCIPFTLFVQYVAYKQSVSRSVQLALVPITFGVGYATVYDFSVNPAGLVFAMCAVVFTALAQIFTNTYQKSLECNALQLLYHTSPYISLGMLIMSPFFDDVRALSQFEYTQPLVMRIAISCVFALGVNISNYLVLGKTSPLTYQVLGHFKTVLILVLGFTVFNKPIDIRNVIGILIAMFGVIAYTEIRRRQSPAMPTLPVTRQKSQDERQP